MSRRSVRALFALSLFTAATLAACGGDDAKLPNGAVAAVDGRPLTEERLATLLAAAGQINLQGPQAHEAARSVANVWADYQLLASAAAHRDSLTDPKIADDALESVVTLLRIRMLSERLIGNAGAPDSTGNAARYAADTMLSARHILVAFPGDPRARNGQPPAPRIVDSVRRRAESIRATLTPANFTATAQQASNDTVTGRRGGDLGVFPRGAIFPPLEKALIALKPGQVSAPVETPLGFHLVYRPTYAEVADRLAEAVGRRRRAVAESTYLVKLERSGKLEVTSDAALWARSVAADPDAHAKDDKVLVRTTAGALTAGRLAHWIATVPEVPVIRAQLPRLPDSTVKLFLHQVARSDLLLKQADSLHVDIPADSIAAMRRAFVNAITTSWARLGVAPASLTGSSDAQRAATAASRVDAYLEKVVRAQAAFVSVPVPVSYALRRKYATVIGDAALDRALTRAVQLRATRNIGATPAPPTNDVEEPITPLVTPGSGGLIGSPVRPGSVPIDTNPR